jgi:oligopeptide transport system substrate-binding protein
MMKRFHLILSAVLAAFVFSGCGKGGSNPAPAPGAAPAQILNLGNGAEPQDLDPQIVTGVTEWRIVSSLMCGLVGYDPKDLHPVPDLAESWDVTPDQLTHTFHLRAAKWSNGEPLTAPDFVKSYHRMLAPSLAAEYAYMLFVVTNAEAFNNGKITNFDEVGFKALDDRTLRVQLNAPTPYFLALLGHQSWYPVNTAAIAKCGPLYERGNPWTRPATYVGCGPFMLADWKQNQIVSVKKNPNFWDAATVKLDQINFHPIESDDTEERAFQSGQLDITETVPTSKIDVYKREHPDLIRIEPYLGIYYYRCNVTKPPLNDRRVRMALALSIDREAIVKSVLRAGQLPAYWFTPPNCAGYTANTHLKMDIPAAKQLLAEAGYPDGKGLPPVEILFNTSAGHKQIAEAIQQMWKVNLGVDAQLVNQEWKVYLDTQHSMNYQVSRSSWIGDYDDPNSFLNLFVTDGGNNMTGWSNKDYDRYIREAGLTPDQSKRFEDFQQAEAILMTEVPVIPIYFYTRVDLMSPKVKGWWPNLLDIHPYKYVYLQ